MTFAPILSGEIRRSVRRIAVDNDDLRDEIGRQVGKHTANGLRFVVGRNDDRHSHADSLITTRGRGAPPCQQRIDAPGTSCASHRESERGEHRNQ